MESKDVYARGVWMLKVSSKKKAQRLVRLLPETGELAWQSGKSIKNTLLSEPASFNYLSFSRVLELRVGIDARNYRQQFGVSAEHEGRWMSIIYIATHTEERRVKMLHLVALTDADARHYLHTLPLLIAKERSSPDQPLLWHAWVQQCWQLLGSDTPQPVSFDDVARLCNHIGIHLKTELMRNYFDKCDVEKKGHLQPAALERFLALLQERPEMDSVLAKYGSTAGLSLEQFHSFLVKEQGVHLGMSDVELLFTKHKAQGKDDMDREALVAFLSSIDNPALDPACLQQSGPLDRPLCEYFLSTSHNTYLIGNQLNSDSSVEGYIRALQTGCRCVELDVWDGTDGQPVVYHGRTLTSKLPFASALRAIAKYAFVSSPYPLILSVEVHCDLQQQEIMAQQLKTILGDALLSAPLPDSDDATHPSPEQLKGRILLKAKRKAAETDQKAEKQDASETATTTTAESSEGELKRRFSNVMKRLRSPSNTSSCETSERPAGNPETDQVADSTQSTRPQLSAPLASLLIYTVGVKCRGFNKKEQYHPFDIVSLGERRLNKTIKEAATDLLDHNRTHLVRSYPAGFRFTSTNYLPQSLWAMGISLVAINYQNHDLGAEINAAFFKLNDGCGYVIKPDLLRRKDTRYKDKEVLSGPSKYRFRISIISAQHLTRGVREKKDGPAQENRFVYLSPLVTVSIYAPGVEPDKVIKHRTSMVIGNGFNPVFANAAFDIPFEVVSDMLELVFVRFQILDNGDPDKIIGRACICLKALQSGYRHLPLYDNLGYQFLFSSLFVHSSLEKS